LNGWRAEMGQGGTGELARKGRKALGGREVSASPESIWFTQKADPRAGVQRFLPCSSVVLAAFVILIAIAPLLIVIVLPGATASVAPAVATSVIAFIIVRSGRTENLDL
jgi:hypothetical protein